MRRQWIIWNATLQLRYNMSYTFIGADEKSSHQSGLRAVFRTIQYIRTKFILGVSEVDISIHYGPLNHDGRIRYSP